MSGTFLIHQDRRKFAEKSLVSAEPMRKASLPLTKIKIPSGTSFSLLHVVAARTKK